MKNKFLMVMFLLSTQTFLVNCAKSSDSAAATPAVGICTVAGQVSTAQYGCVAGSTSYSCPVGQVYATQYGCVAGNISTQAGSCQAGYVFTTQYGCLPGTASASCQAGYVYANQYGCVPGSVSSTVGGTCQAGYVGTVMGCLPQGTCPVNYGYYYGVYNGQTGGWCYQRTY